MSNRNNQVKTYLTDKENAKLERMADKADKSKSELLRQAVLEYTDYDRVERVEHEVKDINEKMDRVLSLVDGQHAHTRNLNNSVPEKARTIIERLYQNHEMPVKDETVEIAIENEAGGDERTIQKYKNQFKKRELLFQHPQSPVWTDKKEKWVMWMENAHHSTDVHGVTEGYGVSVTEYMEIVEALE